MLSILLTISTTIIVTMQTRQPPGPSQHHHHHHQQQQQQQQQQHLGSSSSGSGSSSSNNNQAPNKRFKASQQTTSSIDSVDSLEFPFCDDVNKYEKISRIGKGTFGEVFKARSKKDPQKIVALKRILMDNEQEGFPITAIREIKLLSKLADVENVIRLIEVCRSKPDVNEFSTTNKNSKNDPDAKTDPRSISYLVFDFCHHDLAGLIQDDHDKIKSTPIIICIINQLLEGLFNLHSRNVIHRDMKSANILITKNGVLKIADFGLARPTDNEGAQKDRKYTNRVVTLWYRPPELLLGERNYGGEIDLWGVGCIMCELFIKEPIMKGSTDQNQLELIRDNIGIITPAIWPKVIEYKTFNNCSNMLKKSKFEEPILKKRLLRYTTNKEALDLIHKLLTLDPEKRITAVQANDHEFIWQLGDPRVLRKDFETALSTIATSRFEYTARTKRAHELSANQPMFARVNSHRPPGHRPGSSNNDGQYRDRVY